MNEEIAFGAGRRIALAIGVNRPTDDPDLAALQFAERDARTIAETLTEDCCGFELLQPPLLGADATTTRMRRAIQTLVNTGTDDDMLLLYFSGHGVVIETSPSSSDVYFATADFVSSDVDYNQQGDPNAHLSLSWLWRTLHQSRTAGRVVIVLDCCYAGNVVGAAPDPLQINLRKIIDGALDGINRQGAGLGDKLRVILTATGFNQRAHEAEQHGLFSAHILQALRGEIDDLANDEGELTIQRLHDYLQQQLPATHTPYLIGQVTRSCVLARHSHQSRAARVARQQAERQRDDAEKRTHFLHALRHDHSGFLDSRLESFVGREAELAEIRGRIAAMQPHGGYLTITGQAGQGKSSVIAKLVDEGGRDNLAYHFIPFSPGPDHQVGLLRNLMARLCLKHNLPETYVASDSRPALRDYFPNLLRELADKNQPETIFIDGLDQLEEDASGVRDLSFLPTDPPPGIVFVLGTRPNDTLAPLELLKESREYRLPNLSRGDFDRILQHRDVTLDGHLADRFYTAMQENALYLDLVAKELAQADALEPEQIIARIAANPDNLFSLTTERLRRNRAQWRTTLKPILGVLLAAQEPLSIRALRTLIGTDDETTREGVQRLGGLVPRDGEGRYSLYHLKLHDFLRQDETKPDKAYVFASDEEEDYHQRLANWCSGGTGGLVTIWQDAPPRDALERERRTYARQHYIAHLKAARSYEELWQVLDRGDYGRAKLRHDPSTRAYVLDLDIARDAVIAATGGDYATSVQILPRLWRYSLLRCSLSSQADNLTDAMFDLMVKLGREQEAIGLAEVLSNLARKACVITNIGIQIATLPGRKHEGEQLIARGCQVARDMPVAQRWKPLCDLATALHEANYSDLAATLVAEAAASSREMDHQHEIDATSSRIAECYAQQGQTDEALVVVRAISDESYRIWALRSIAQALVDEDDLTHAYRVLGDALAAAHTIMNDDRRSSALRVIVQSLAQQERIEEAFTTAHTIMDDDRRSSALQAIVQSLAQQERIEEAFTTAHTIMDDFWRTRALMGIAQTLVATDDLPHAYHVLEEAFTTTSSIADVFRRAMALMGIAQTLVATDDFPHAHHVLEEALTVAYAISNDHIQIVALLGIVQTLVAMSDLTRACTVLMEALTTARAVSNDDTQAGVLRDVAQNLAQKGCIDDSVTIARAISNNYWRAGTLKSIAQVLLDLGNSTYACTVLTEALTTARAIANDFDRARALRAIAQTLTANTPAHALAVLEEALTAARIIADEEDRAEALQGIATALVDTDNPIHALAVLEEALTAARAVANDFDRARALRAIAQAFVQQERIDDALTTAQAIADELWQAMTCQDIVKTLAYQGHTEEALVIAQTIADDRSQVDVLQTIACAIANAGDFTHAHMVLTDALTIARAIANDFGRARALQGIATALVDTGNLTQAHCVLDEALTTAHTIEDVNLQAVALQTIATALVDTGNLTQAHCVLDEALTTAHTIAETPHRYWVLRGIAQVLAQQRRIAEALTTAHSIEMDHFRIETLQTIAEALATQEQSDKLLELVQQEWRTASTRDYLCELAELALPLLASHPDLTLQLAEAFAWVDGQLG